MISLIDRSTIYARLNNPAVRRFEEVEGADVISATSPLGAALDGASAGDSITYDAPNGSLTVKVLSVDSI